VDNVSFARSLSAAVVLFASMLQTLSATPKLGVEDIPADVPPEVRRSIEELFSKQSRVRGEAAQKLCSMGETAAPSVPFLVQLLADDAKILESGVTPDGHSYELMMSPGEYAANALERLGGPAVMPLIGALQDKSASSRARAAGVLGRLNDPRADDALVNAMHDPSASVRHAAAFWIPIRHEGIERAYVSLLTDRDVEIRRLAAKKLIGFSGADTVEALIRVARDKDTQLRESAIEALARTKDPRAVPVLLAAMKDKEWPIRYQAAQGLGLSGDERAFEPLRAALYDREGMMQSAATAALAELRDPRAFEALLAAVRGTDESLRYLSVIALGNLQDSRAVEHLLTMLNAYDPNRPVGMFSYEQRQLRDALVDALGKLKTPSL
jgi:HEAT repeat protein